MSLPEVLSKVRALSRLDKIRLIQILAQELERDESNLIEPGRAFSAAATLLEVLEDEKVQA